MSEQGEWIEWKGGPQPQPAPVSPGTLVWVRFRFENTISRTAKLASVWHWHWADEPSGGDIIAYRVVEPAPTAT